MSNKATRYAFGFWKRKKWFWHPSAIIPPGVDPDYDFMFGAKDQLDLSFREEPYQARRVLEHPENPVRIGMVSKQEGISSPTQGRRNQVEREFKVTTTVVVTKKVRVHAANNAKAAAEAQKKVNKHRRKIPPFKKFKLGKFIGKAATKLIERRFK